MNTSTLKTDTSLDSTTQGTKKDMDKEAIMALMTLASTAKNMVPSKVETTREKAQESFPESESGPFHDNHLQLPNTISGNRFPAKLISILNNPEYAKILSWSSDGEAFMFHDRKAFETLVLPSTFKDSKFDSFLRKLYRWGFAKCQVYSRVGCPAYRHEKFLRNFPDECKHMECRSKPKIQIPHFINHHQHGGAHTYAPIYNHNPGAFSGLPFPQHTSPHQQHMVSTGRDAGADATGSHQQELMPDLFRDKESFKSLSEYISSRRKHHQRVMNSAASLFKSGSMCRNSNINLHENILGMGNTNMNLNMGRMPMPMPMQMVTSPSYQESQEAIHSCHPMMPHIDRLHGIVDGPIIDRNGAGNPTSNHHFHLFNETMRMPQLERQYAQDQVSLNSRFIDNGRLRQTI